MFLGLLALIWSAMCSAAGIAWNAPRLASSFALAQNLPLYGLRTSGQQLGWIYGPGFPIWFLPVTCFKNLTVGFAFAGFWNALTLVGPIYLAIRTTLVGHRVIGVAATLLGGALMFAHETTQTAFYFIHVDAVCIGFGLLGCVSLYLGVRGWKPGLPVAALAVVLAFWTKQTALFLLPAMLCWLWRENVPGLIQKWLWWVFVTGAGVTVLIFIKFGGAELLFNVWYCNARSPWAGGWELLIQQVWDTIRAGWLWWIALALSLSLMRSTGWTLSTRASQFSRLLIWVAVWQVPVGFLASLKVGGALNSLHSLTYFLVVGLVVAADLLTKVPSLGSVRIERLAASAFVGVTFLGVLIGYRQATERGVVWSPHPGQQQALETAKVNAGRAYFPWNPLVTIISDHKIYPFDDALLCLWRAGLSPSMEAIRAAVPRDASIIYHEPVQSHFALNYFGKQPAQDQKGH